MQSVAEFRRYGMMPQFLHWMTVVLVIVAWALGTFGDDLPKGAARATGLFLHISAGLVVLAAVVARLLWRVIDPPPEAEPDKLGGWLGALAVPAAHVAHLALYLLLFVVPIVGIVAQFARGDALPLFGAIEIASPWVRDRAFAHTVTEIHELAANALVIVALLHAAAAMIHHYVLGDGTLVRMLPRGLPRSQGRHGE